MSADSVAVELPSGHTWTFTKNPKWGAVRRLTGENADPSEALAAFTEGWTYEAEVGAEAIDGLPMEDVITALGVFNAEVLPLLEGLSAKISTPPPENSLNGSTPESPSMAMETSESGGPTLPG